jgi:ribosomal protein S18 acetylase RimI-like enzyme
VLRPHQSVAELAAHEPPEAFAAGVFEGDELVAAGLIGPEGQPGDWRVRGLATLPAFRGGGAGSAVLNALLEHARAGGGAAVWANVRTPARPLYERAGFSVISDEFELPRIGPHVVMRRAL